MGPKRSVPIRSPTSPSEARAAPGVLRVLVPESHEKFTLEQSADESLCPSVPVFIFPQVIEAHKSSCMFLFLLWLPGNSEPNSYLNVISHVTTQQSFCSKLFSDFACLLKLIYLSIIVFYLFSHFTVHIFVSHRSLHKHTQIFRICILCMYTYTFYMFFCLICAYVRLVIRKNNFSSISS